MPTPTAKSFSDALKQLSTVVANAHAAEIASLQAEVERLSCVHRASPQDGSKSAASKCVTFGSEILPVGPGTNLHTSPPAQPDLEVAFDVAFLPPEVAFEDAETTCSTPRTAREILRMSLRQEAQQLPQSNRILVDRSHTNSVELTEADENEDEGLEAFESPGEWTLPSGLDASGAHVLKSVCDSNNGEVRKSNSSVKTRRDTLVSQFPSHDRRLSGADWAGASSDMLRRLAEVDGNRNFERLQTPEPAKVRAHRLWMNCGEIAGGTLVVTYMGFMAWEVQSHAESGTEPPWASAVSLFFCCAFTFELLSRLFARRRQFFYGSMKYWNLFDFVVLLCMWLEQMLEDVGKSVGVLRLLRLLRLTRVSRLVHVVRFLSMFRHGQLFIKVTMKTFAPVVSLFAIFALMSFGVAIVLAQAAVYSCAGEMRRKDLLCNRFGSLWISWFSIAQVITGGISWGTLADALDDLEFQYLLLLTVFGVFAFLVALNTVTGLFVKEVRDISECTFDDSYFHAKLQHEQHALERMTDIFYKVDLNRSGSISKEELQHACRSDDMLLSLNTLGFDTHRAHLMFSILDIDGSGQVSLEEFVVGCLRFSGNARAVDVERLQRNVHRIEITMASVERYVKKLEEKMGSAYATVEQSPAKLSVTRNPSVSDASRKLTGFQTKLTDGSGQSTLDPLDFRKASSQQSAPGRWNSQGSVSIDNLGLNRSPTAQSARLIDFFSMGASQPTACKTARWDNISSLHIGKRGKAPCIEKTEQRSMLLSDLIQVGAWASSLCAAEEWVDMRSGDVLQPSDVNLYHFDYYVISPCTAVEVVNLEGLSEKQYYSNGTLTQVNDVGQVIAEGSISVDVHGTDVQIQLTKGKFQSKLSQSHAPVLLDGVSCGTPAAIATENSISYKEMVSSTPADPSWYCCHWWGEKLIHFIDCCKKHAKCRGLSQTEASYWVCGYALRQHELGVEISEDPEQSSFRRAMRLAKGVLLVLDFNAIPFKRIWCDYELFKTALDSDKMFDIASMSKGRAHLMSDGPCLRETYVEQTHRELKFPIKVLAKGLQVTLENGNATVAADIRNILTSMGMCPLSGAFDETVLRENLALANSCIKGHFALAAWPQALQRGLVRNFPRDDDDGEAGTLSLPAILRADIHRTYLKMSFSGMDVEDSDMDCIAEGLPPNLTSLSLSFEGSKRISDRGLSLLAQALERLSSLQQVHLDFLACTALTDTGVSFLASKWPPHLEGIDLNLALCTNMTIDAAKALASDLPKQVTKVHVDFTGTKISRVFDSVKQLKSLSKGWSVLALI